MKKLQLSFPLIALALILSVSAISAQNPQQVDQRALKHYTVEEISQMPDYKIEQINFLFNESYLIPEKFQEKINAEQVDIMLFTGYRKQAERVNVPLNINTEGREGGISEEYIILLSADELKEAFQKIRNNHSTTQENNE